MKGVNFHEPPNDKIRNEIDAIKARLNDGEKSALDTLRARPMLRFEYSMNNESFNFIAIDGLKLSLQRGTLGLVKAAASISPPKTSRLDVMGLMMGDGKPTEELEGQPAALLENATETVTEAENNTLVQRATSAWTKVTSFFWPSK
jgi:hypothetical protein